MNVISSCVVCGSNGLVPLKRYSAFHLSRCPSCGMIFSTLDPGLEKLEEHYDLYGRNDYHSPITVKRYNELLGFLESERKLNRILDLGCGIGFFLEEALKRKWHTYGTEFTESAVDICAAKGIQMFLGDLGNIDFGGLKFDVITSIEVLEHINNPLDHLSVAISLLRPGGVMYITTPNIRSFNSRILREKWNSLSYPEHLCYYSKRSLDYLLRQSGFTRIFLRSEGISPERLFTSLENRKVDHSSPNTRDEILRKKVESNPVLRGMKKLANSTLDTLGLGESIKALYRNS